MRIKLLLPLLCGVFLAPGIIVLHECGHFGAAYYFGMQPTFHYAQTRYTLRVKSDDEAVVRSAHRKINTTRVAGPAVEASLAIVGFAWLWLGRRSRKSSAATVGDWLATSLAMGVGRWLRALTGTLANPQPRDEAFISQAMGLPAWALPYLLCAVSIAFTVAVVRLHPRGSRLQPFAAFVVGGMMGLALWMKVLGPLLLP